MNRTILTGILILAAGVSGAMAADKKDKDKGSAQPANQAAAAPKGPAPKSAEELKALQALFGAAGKPDEVIAAAETVLEKFPNSDFKDTVLFLEADAYRQKGDKEKAQIFAERTLAANPKYFQADLMLAEGIVQGTREHDLDRDDKLAKADKYANDAITSVNAATKPNPQLTDPQWEELKKDFIAQAHDALGMSAIQSKKWDVAITELKTASEGAAHPEPAYLVRPASAYQGSGKNDEAIAIAEKVMNDPTNPAAIKSVAQSIRAAAVVAKRGASGQPSGAAPPAQIEVKKP
jgi:tetratricopeptide (TPR) repeat protein